MLLIAQALPHREWQVQAFSRSGSAWRAEEHRRHRCLAGERGRAARGLFRVVLVFLLAVGMEPKAFVLSSITSPFSSLFWDRISLMLGSDL